MDGEIPMIERDISDSFPDDAFVTRTCLQCGQDYEVMLRFLESEECPTCTAVLDRSTDEDWFEVIDRVERDVA
jgi:hypothetical protein